MDLMFRDVDSVEEVLAHEVVIADRVVVRQADVLVQVERAHPGEIHPLRLTRLDQALVDPDRCRARGQAEHQVGLAIERREDLTSDQLGRLVRVLAEGDLDEERFPVTRI